MSRTWERIQEEITYGVSPKGNYRWNQCNHYRVTPVNFSTPVNAFGSYIEYYNWFMGVDFCKTAANDAIRYLGNVLTQPELDFQKNNDFRIFILLFQIDELFAKFTQKYVANLMTMRYRDTAAFIKWDLGPLLADFQALTETYFDLKFRINQELKALKPIPFMRTLPIPLKSISWNEIIYSGTVQFHGSLDATNIPDEVTLPIILDEFGANLRFTDLLDLVPFSFLLSNVIPNITEFLDSQHPNRWFNPGWVYDGWITMKLNVIGRLNLSGNLVPQDGHAFVRRRVSIVPSKGPELHWKFPGSKGLTDALALFSAGSKSKKIINHNLKLSRRITFF